MFDENMSAAPGESLNVMALDVGKMLTINKSVKLSEEEAIEFMNDWNLVVAYTLLDQPGFIFNPESISQKIGISKVESQSIIEKLLNMQLIESNGKIDQYKNNPVYFDDSFMSSADMLSIHNKLSMKSLSKITSKDVFSFQFEMLSRKVIQRYQPEFADLVQKMVNDSKFESDIEAYVTLFSFCKASKSRKDK